MGRRAALAAPDADSEGARLTRADRRDALLDVAAELASTGDIDAVSMEAVAERAGVSRPLVYKHFANRTEMLGALYQRESALLHAELAAAVASAKTLEAMFRALVHGSLRVPARRAATFAALRSAGVRDKARRDEQRRRDSGTLRYFTAQAMREFDLDESEARAGVGSLLGMIDSVLAQLRARPGREHADLLENTYVTLAMGGIRALARQ